MSEWIYDPKANRCRKTDGGKTMSDKIEEIRARHTSDTWRRYELKAQIHDDREMLLAEVDRLRAENERLTRERDEARAEVARMMKLHTPPADIPWPARDLRALPYQTAAGCMCPAGANLSCQNSFCPRRNPPGVITCQGGKP